MQTSLMFILLMSLLESTTPHDSELRVLASRRAITAGEIRIKSVDFVRSKGIGDFIPGREVEFELSFEEDRLRTVQLTGRYGDNNSLTTFAKEGGLRVDGRTYATSYDLKDPDRLIAVRFASRKSASEWMSFARHVFDPRLFGLQPVPFGILHACEYEGFVAHPTRSSTSLERVVLRGSPVHFVTYQDRNNTARMWISPEHGWNLLKSELVGRSGERAVLTCKVEQFGEVWFPRSVVFEQFDATNKMVKKNVASVVDAKLNLPVAPGRLTLASLQPANGAMVYDVTDPSHPIGSWDGKEISPVRAKSKTSSKRSDPGAPSRRDNRFLYGAAALGVGFVLLTVLYWRSRAKPSPRSSVAIQKENAANDRNRQGVQER